MGLYEQPKDEQARILALETTFGEVGDAPVRRWPAVRADSTPEALERSDRFRVA